MMRHIGVFGSSQTRPTEPDYLDAVRLGGRLAENGLVVVNGGYGGLMEAVSKGAAEAGGSVVGVTVPSTFPGRTGANRWITEEQTTDDLVARIRLMLTMSDAAIALPGSIGTLTELLMAWNLAFVAPFNGRLPKPLVAVGNVWNRVVPFLTAELDTDGSLVTCVPNVDAAVEALLTG